MLAIYFKIYISRLWSERMPSHHHHPHYSAASSGIINLKLVVLYVLCQNWLAYLALQSVDRECTSINLFQKSVVHTNLDIYEHHL
jgi:hypothetical protein